MLPMRRIGHLPTRHTGHLPTRHIGHPTAAMLPPPQGHPIAVTVWIPWNATSSSLFGHSTSVTVWARYPSDTLDYLPLWWFRHATSTSHWAGIRSSSIRTSNNIKISWGFYVPQRLYLTLNGKLAFPYWVILWLQVQWGRCTSTDTPMVNWV